MECFALYQVASEPRHNVSEGLEKVLTAFTAGLLLITVSELGDKTFFIAVLLAARHARRPVFLGVVTALATMTVLSVLLGQVASLLPKSTIHYAEVILFLGFGLKLLYEGTKEWWQAQWKKWSTAKDGKTLEASEGEGCDEEQEAIAAVIAADKKLPEKPTSLAIFLESFGLTFVAEWGDRTQFATIALAAGSVYPVGVTLGAILGHSICAAIAVIGGRLIAGRISEQLITLLGGVLFIIFGLVALAS